MASISEQIRRVQLKKSPEQVARESSEARRERAKLASKLKDQRRGGSTTDPAFSRQLEAKAAAVRAGQGPRVRSDLPHVLDQLRAEGKLPPAPGGPERVGYVPTPEEILGDDALPRETTPAAPARADLDCPSADDVLSGASAESSYSPGDLSPEEIAEIDRLNPKRKGQTAPAKRVKR